MTKFGIIVLSLVLLIGCQTTGHLVTPASLGTDQIVVVGKLRVTPAVKYINRDGDRNLNAISEEEGVKLAKGMQMWMHLTTSEKLATRMVTGTLYGPNQFDTGMEQTRSRTTEDYTDSDETFLIRGPKAQVLYFLGFSKQLGLDANAKIQVPDGAKAIYIGTFDFQRNRMLEVTRFTHIDEYDQALTDFHKVFPEMELVRANLEPFTVPAGKQ